MKFTLQQFVSQTKPENFDDILNIFYTVINSGQETFSFYCPDEYEECTNDIKKLAMYIYEYLIEVNSSLVWANVTDVRITKDNSKINYKFKDDGALVEIVYDSTSKTFTSGNNSIQFVNAVEQSVEFSKIKLELDTPIGNIAQQLNMITDEVTTSLNGNDLPAGIVGNDEIIKELASKIRDGKLYKYSGTSETIYFINKDGEIMMIAYKASTYSISYKDDTYILIP